MTNSTTISLLFCMKDRNRGCVTCAKQNKNGVSEMSMSKVSSMHQYAGLHHMTPY